MADKDQTAMLREAAKARGFRLVKSRRRKAGGDFGKYGLTDAETKEECFGFGQQGLTATADEVLTYLRGGETASWKRSLMGVVKSEGAHVSAHLKRSRETLEPAPKPDRDKKPARAKGASTRPSTVRETHEKGKDQPAATPLTLRPAKRADTAAIAAILGTKPKALAKRLDAAIRARQPPILAETTELVGIVAWTTVDRLQAEPIARITLIHVAKESRREALGTRLIEEACRRIAKAGIAEIELLLGVDLDAPNGFLRATGWKRASSGYRRTAG